MAEMILIYITCKDKKEAEKIGLNLIEKKLAACVNIFPLIKSIFRWKGRIEKNNEAVMIVKTVKNNFSVIEKEVKKISGFNMPCILEVPIIKGNREYLNWIKSEIEQ